MTLLISTMAETSEFAPKELKNFVQLNLVGNNNSNKPLNIDADLVNAWGISFSPSGLAWVSSEGKGISTIYNFDGLTVANAVTIPHALSTTTGHPTGHVYNPTSDFKLPNGNAATFIFATSDGIISGWNIGNNAVEKIDRSAGASYLGVALANKAVISFYMLPILLKTELMCLIRTGTW
jgi:TIGR03118 family protein